MRYSIISYFPRRDSVYVPILGITCTTGVDPRRFGRAQIDNDIAKLRPLSGVDDSAVAHEEGNRMTM